MIDVVIPVRESRIDQTLMPTLYAFRQCSSVNQIIVVWDGPAHPVPPSWEIFCCLGPQEGKGQAVTLGLDIVNSSRVILCDADLYGFTKEHAEILASENSGMILGITDYVKGAVPWSVDYGVWSQVTGERSLPTHILRGMELHGYAMEVQINEAVRIAGLPVTHRPLSGVTGALRFNERRAREMQRDGDWLRTHFPASPQRSGIVYPDREPV